MNTQTINTQRTQGEWIAKELQIYPQETGITLAVLTTSGGENGISDEEAEANAAYIVKSVNCHEELFKMVIDLKNCIKRLSQDCLTQDKRDAEAQWEGEAHELLSRITPDWYQNANAAKQKAEQ